MFYTGCRGCAEGDPGWVRCSLTQCSLPFEPLPHSCLMSLPSQACPLASARDQAHASSNEEKLLRPHTTLSVSLWKRSAFPSPSGEVWTQPAGRSEVHLVNTGKRMEGGRAGRSWGFPVCLGTQPQLRDSLGLPKYNSFVAANIWSADSPAVMPWRLPQDFAADVLDGVIVAGVATINEE